MFVPETPLDALNWDILLYMVTFLSRPDVSSLMKTSHEFYELGLRELFRDPVELRANNVQSLHKCLHIGKSNPRSHYLRDVTMSCTLSHLPPVSRESNVSMEQLLCDILQNASRLRKLRFDWGAASLSGSFSVVMPTLHCLEELYMPLVSQELWDSIKGLRAPIRKLAVHFGPTNHLPFLTADPVSLLEPFQSTLEELDLAVVQCEDMSVVYPAVQKLSLADCYYGRTRGGIDIGPVMCAFPNVVDFSLSAAKAQPALSHWKEGRSCDHADLIERCRTANTQWQREHPHAAAGSGWAALESVTAGHVVDLYMLGLRRAVPRVEIRAFSKGTLWMFRHVVADTRPSHLAISLFAREDVLDCLPRLVPDAESADALRHLTLVLQCDDADIPVERIIAGVTGMLARPRLRVERLSLCMRRWDTVGPYRLSPRALRALDAALAAVWDGQAGAVAARLLDGIPALRELTLTVAEHEGRWART
ncbi:hypothetical protein GSI_11004 [Ganoderma sinense ZZ0214-1]|uniref:F-box domain-containing protein n=1 Tax=Ganoderma sinense ZZ0214-1 TaxID=1077348 RepID=A0A2G8S251_9APHY|nr:hypothetical protein GSI_11004 [Ganoderma sinense ZZ0214-1]